MAEGTLSGIGAGGETVKKKSLNKEAETLFVDVPARDWPASLLQTVADYKKQIGVLSADEAYSIIESWVKLGKNTLSPDEVLSHWESL